MIRASNLDDPLALIVTPDGDESPLFPRDLRTLFGYDREPAFCIPHLQVSNVLFKDEKTKKLLHDFGLQESGTRERDINKFMAHLGIQFHLIPVPLDPNP